ncbi:hypothetical protein SLEP1_g47777 [Rubroshorea leprosula]|uniref:ABC-type xenobiotic transporter n=1 Tax=Rubroshorea leprosula TaxID=152421 RepID=A0AAV5LTV9_9ROSI|nr:hypothetical protein SLEP1_g47777 [Rubroshorea leprosula]
MSLFISLNAVNLPPIRSVKICSTLAFLYAGFLCISSLQEAITDRTISVKIILDILSFPGSILLLFCAFKQHDSVDTYPVNADACYTPLQGEDPDATGQITSCPVTPFAKAGFFSKMSFWWLNPLMKKGREKILEEQDIPKLREADRAQTCYLMYMEQLSKHKQKERTDPPPMFSILLSMYWEAIFVTGFFALVKVLSLSTGPLFLRAFIRVAEGKEAFKHESYLLTVGLFVAKCLESLSERQWFFRTRLVGLQVRSLLSAAIHQKQLRLSNSARMTHSPGEIVNYVSLDAYRIGEFPYWFHQIWSTSLQLCLALFTVYYSVGWASVAALIAIVLTVAACSPLVKLQHEYQKKLMVAQGKRLKAITEALANMKVLKLYAWETHFKNVIEGLRKEEFKWISGVMAQKGWNLVLFWSSPTIVPVVTFWTCYFLGIPLDAANAFTFLSCLRIVQEPIRLIPDVLGVFIEAKVSLDRIVRFLQEPELTNRNLQPKCNDIVCEHPVFIRCTEISWDTNPSSRATLRNINLTIKPGEKVAICGEVGSGKSTVLAAVLGEVPNIKGIVDHHGKIAYVSQTAWIQTGSIQENILFGLVMDPIRYAAVLQKCCLVKDLEMLPYGDLTEIGERGVNLSGGQKQRVQLARALYQDADIYLLDDPFSAVDAHTATRLFNDYIMGALSGKTVLLVTHQVDFLPAFSSILLMSGGEIIRDNTYNELLSSSQEFQDLVNAHNNTTETEMQVRTSCSRLPIQSTGEIQSEYVKEKSGVPSGEQLIKQEEREIGDTGLKPYLQYLSHNKGFLYFSLASIFHMMFLIGQFIQNFWLAADIQNSTVNRVKLITVYTLIGCGLAIFLFLRSLYLVVLSCRASESIFSTLLKSLFRASMSFYDSTPLGRILSRVSSDLSIIDLEIAIKSVVAVGSTMNAYLTLAVLGILAWPVVFVIIPTVYLSILLQKHYFASSKELVRINGTTKASARHKKNHIAGLLDDRGSLVTDKTGIEGLCIKSFRDLFTSKYTGPNSSILSALQGRVSPMMVNNLDRDFTSYEVLVALKQIHSSKAPGPDGMNANFYKNYWHIIGGDIISAALDFLNNGIMVRDVNLTHIVLIPKVKSPSSMKDFRPISLCNVLYKIISKVLTNRLKSILPHIISNNQSAFVPGRLIYDNIMVAFEAIHHLKNKKVGRRGHMAVKLDLSKAFDRVEWNFLEDTMRAMGFPEWWINHVMTCVRTVEYSVLINGCPTKKFTPSRGIRQGDPLSPFLFLLCAEGLSALLSRAISRGDLKGLTLCQGCPCQLVAIYNIMV